MKAGRRKPLLLPVTLLLLPFGCARTTEQADPEKAAAIPVRIETVRLTPWEEIYESSGTVRAREKAIIASKVMGTILSVTVKPGDAVRAGQLLVQIESEELAAEINHAEAGQAAAERAVSQAEKALAAAEAEARLASLTYRRLEGLLAKRSVSQAEFDQAEARNRAAEAALEAAAARVQEAQAQQRQAAAALVAAQVRKGYTEIAAPFAGIVAAKNVDPGTVATPGMPLITLETGSNFQLEASLPETRLAAVRVGQLVRLSIPAIGLDASGRVVEVEPTADVGSRASRVKIGLPAAAGLRSGLFGRAYFSLGSVDRLSVPQAAVERQGQLVSVFVVSQGVARRRLVTLGRTSGDRPEVLSGLSPGEAVAVSDVEKLADGSPVEIRP